MRFIKIFLTIITTALLITACNSSGNEDVGYQNPDQNTIAENEIIPGENQYWARDNLDLQRVGNLLEESRNAEDFEYRLNSDDGINNLDLNGDGYADYLSVSEFDDRSDNQRGFTIFDRFGPDEIQEIARFILDRNSFDDPGARVLLTGNEQIYGDGYNYETNWLDKSLAIANWAFGNRNEHYESPYYYENYPNDYEVYPVVETPVYRTRVEEYYPQPVFVRTVNPAITQIRINSQYNDRSADEIYANLAKPTERQAKFRENHPKPPTFIPNQRVKVKNTQPEFDNRREKSVYEAVKSGKRNNEKFDKRDKDFKNKPEKVERKFGRPDKPNKVERQIIKMNKPNKVERKNMKPMKFDKPGKADKRGGDGQNRGGGKGHGNGGGKGHGGGKKGKN